ncbi:biopolymer transporter ExbD [Acidihalobacter yilgarnensis]|uniref:Biopolymer transporter ExbD n=2 Tax=Acidihalobacter yilgarnensis TaxID=2819280 RepID=A0A1D8ISX5_9GAMM|nr:biopolymer transporter ExbD [Acidihalobacter yilgarnensis]
MKYFEPKKGRIEIIPMIDIMFFLLVFFMMITLHMIPSQGVSSDLPKSSTASTLKHPNVVIDVDPQGTIHVAGKLLSPKQLSDLLMAKGDPSHTVVTIAGAGTTDLQNIMAVMDACRTAGVVHIGIAATRAHS